MLTHEAGGFQNRRARSHKNEGVNSGGEESLWDITLTNCREFVDVVLRGLHFADHMGALGFSSITIQ
jgi:hypothetical protein